MKRVLTNTVILAVRWKACEKKFVGLELDFELPHRRGGRLGAIRSASRRSLRFRVGLPSGRAGLFDTLPAVLCPPETTNLRPIQDVDPLITHRITVQHPPSEICVTETIPISVLLVSHEPECVSAVAHGVAGDAAGGKRQFVAKAAERRGEGNVDLSSIAGGNKPM